MRITVEKQMISLLGMAKRFLRPFPLGDVVKNNNTALKCAIRAFERSAANTEQAAFGHVWVADKDLYGVNTLTLHRPHQRQLVGGILSHSIGQIDAILIRPLVGCSVRRTDAQDLLGSRIKE